MKSQLYLTDIPRVLVEALETRARTMGTSVSNVVGEILSARYGIEFTPSGRKMDERFSAAEYTRPNGQAIGHTLNMYLPATVVEAVRDEAAMMTKRQRTIVLESLAASLGVDLPPDRKPRNRGHGRPRGRMVKTP